MFIKILGVLVPFFEFVFFGLRNWQIPGNIDGNVAREGQFPWHVTVLSEKGILCEGALISPNWVVTAARCVSGSQDTKIGVGSNKFTIDNLQYKSKKIEIHPGFSPSDLFRKDIALVELLTPVNITDKVKPIALPTKSMTLDSLLSKNFELSGYGYHKLQKRPYWKKTLRFSTLRILKNDQCNNLFWRNSPNGDFCTQLVNLDDNQCFGNYGSPLMRAHDNKPRIIGIVTSTVGECEVGLSGFQSIHSNLDWIIGITGINVK